MLEKVQKEIDTDDDLSSVAEGSLPPPRSSKAARARARLRAHLEILLVPTNVEMVKKAMTLLEEVPV